MIPNPITKYFDPLKYTLNIWLEDPQSILLSMNHTFSNKYSSTDSVVNLSNILNIDLLDREDFYGSKSIQFVIRMYSYHFRDIEYVRERRSRRHVQGGPL